MRNSKFLFLKGPTCERSSVCSVKARSFIFDRGALDVPFWGLVQPQGSNARLLPASGPPQLLPLPPLLLVGSPTVNKEIPELSSLERSGSFWIFPPAQNPTCLKDQYSASSELLFLCTETAEADAQYRLESWCSQAV